VGLLQLSFDPGSNL